jgi:nucleoside-diphosphate-sugar epimerase
MGTAVDTIAVGDIASRADWSRALEGVDCVVHTAARAHVGTDFRSSSDLYIATNARATLELSDAAARAGVRRFIYLSSIKVNGEETGGRPYAATDEPCPHDVYAKSKWLGEQHVQEVAARTAMDAAIVRSPLVYGPNVRANFLRLLRWVDHERPLPFGAVRNSRSLVSVWNLTSLLLHLLDVPLESCRVWMVSDGEDLSTPELIRRLGTAMNRRVRLIAVPTVALRVAGILTGQQGAIARLCGSLTVDTSPTHDELGWAPPITVDEGLARTAEWYGSSTSKN